MKSLLIIHSYHHGNTRKVAEAMAEVLDAPVKNATDIHIHEPDQYELVGFGAGIDSGHHYKELLELAGKLPPAEGKRCFVFSTAGVYTDKKMLKDHKALVEILLAKGFAVKGQFSCKGLDTNSFLKYLGGLNKGCPTQKDLDDARRFAEKMKQE